MNKFLIAALALAPLAACGDATDTSATSATTGSSGSGCLDFATAKSGASFKSDVMPIFQRSCNFSACHNSEASTPQEGLGLGAPNGITQTDDELKAVRDAIVGATSERSSLAMVEAGSPETSWLMAKIAYSKFTACAAISDTCAPAGCGTRMPLNSPALDAADVDTIAGWIKDGALNN